jgi:hypothetical protein
MVGRVEDHNAPTVSLSDEGTVAKVGKITALGGGHAVSLVASIGDADDQCKPVEHCELNGIVCGEDDGTGGGEEQMLYARGEEFGVW